MQLFTISLFFARTSSFILLFLFFLINIPVVLAGTYPSLQDIDFERDIDTFINQAPEDQLENFRNFLHNLARDGGILPPQEETAIENVVAPRFGWESLLIFVGGTILGYILIRHGTDIFNYMADFTSRLFSSVAVHHVVDRESIRIFAHQVGQNPEARQAMMEVVARMRAA